MTDTNACACGANLTDTGRTECAACAANIAAIQAKLDTVEWHDADTDAQMYPRVERLIDGFGCEWLFDDKSLADYELLGETFEDAQRLVTERVDATDPDIDFGLQNKIETLSFDLKVADDHISEQDAEIARLRAIVDEQARDIAALGIALNGYIEASEAQRRELVTETERADALIAGLDALSPLEALTRLLRFRWERAAR